MTSKQGYDDMFNEGLFRTTLNSSKVTRPGKWPKSVSEMRGHTDYGSQGMHPGHDSDHMKYRIKSYQLDKRNSVGCVPGYWGGCAGEDEGGRAPYATPDLVTTPLNPTGNPGAWVFKPQGQWVWMDKK